MNHILDKLVNGMLTVALVCTLAAIAIFIVEGVIYKVHQYQESKKNG